MRMFVCLLLVLAAFGCTTQRRDRLTGTVTSASGEAAAHVVVVVRADSSAPRISALTDEAGRFEMAATVSGTVAVTVLSGGKMVLEQAGAEISAGRTLDLELPVMEAGALHASSLWLSSLPDGEEKRKFILDCTGCHQFNETRVLKDGAARSEEQWGADVGRMLRYAGARSAFPVIAADRDSFETAKWLAAHSGAGIDRGTAPTFTDASSQATITEYDLPVPPDLPHDIAVGVDGEVLITGMFTHQIYRLNPETDEVSTTTIPTENANPRAIELDSVGNWWVLLGLPQKVARFDVANGTWDAWDIGMYPHSVAIAPDGQTVWFNGHFTKAPELIGRLDVASGETETFEVPLHPMLASEGGPVPYEQRIAPDGTVWISELQGNRMVSYAPGAGTFDTFDMPETWSGPRRFDIAEDGTLWIPAYAANALVRFDPATETFTEHELPATDCLPYVARVSPVTGHVWIGTAAADLVYRFEPASEEWTAFHLATRGATIRHMAIDPRNDDVWLAYGASPSLHPARVARLKLD